jgi:hydroxymethylglutaryl-CoA reductase (NADPH)
MHGSPLRPILGPALVERLLAVDGPDDTYQARKHLRIPLSIKFSLRIEASEFSGLTEDFSVAGLKIQSCIGLAKGTPLILQCYFGKLCYLNLAGQVIFSHALPEASSQRIIGIKLSALRASEQKILASAIEEVTLNSDSHENSLLKIFVSHDHLAIEAASLLPESPHRHPVSPLKALKRIDLVPKHRKIDYTFEALQKRRDWLRAKTGVSLNFVANLSEAPDKLRGTIENPIGTAQIPLGVAGPLKVNGDYAKGLFYVPMATTEGALTYTCNQGMQLISLAGGAKSVILKDEIHIAPVFSFRTVSEANHFSDWLDQNFHTIKSLADSTSRHGKLLRLEPDVLDRNVIVKFYYTTGDAMGLNIITFGTEAACKYIVAETKPLKFFLQSSFSGIKKVTSHNFVRGYGKTVFSEAIIPASLIKRVFGICPSEIVEFYRLVHLTTTHAGMIGINGHTANALTAIFIACGQDTASVVDSHVGVTNFELAADNSLYVSVKLPSLLVGTVGGGTDLATQKECLNLIGCHGAGKAKKFAEIIAATVLAGELAICARVANGTFSDGHRKYGRKTINNSSWKTIARASSLSSDNHSRNQGLL